MHDQRHPDRRVQKTRAHLLEALNSLLHEKPYDAIVVQDILERANVGRSTFYTHFRDKNELLAAGIDDLLNRSHAAGAPAERLLRFSLPIFEHIGRHRGAGTPTMGTRSRTVVHERLRRALSKRVETELRKLMPPLGSTELPTELAVRHITSTFLCVLEWWVDTQSSLSPPQVNDLFRSLVLPVVPGA